MSSPRFKKRKIRFSVEQVNILAKHQLVRLKFNSESFFTLLGKQPECLIFNGLFKNSSNTYGCSSVYIFARLSAKFNPNE
jgi:hypothetical protein